MSFFYENDETNTFLSIKSAKKKVQKKKSILLYSVGECGEYHNILGSNCDHSSHFLR
jgi:hypothetical protein